MRFAYLSRWRFVAFCQICNPTSVRCGNCFPFQAYKNGPPSSSLITLLPPLKAYLEYYPIVLGIYFLPQFLRKLICGLKFVISFSLVGVVR